jgi:hypothetical protein
MPYNQWLDFEIMNKWYLKSLICGMVPLLFGITIFLFWLATRAHILMIIGLLNITAGLIFFAIGLFAVVKYIFESKKNNSKNYYLKAIIALLILIANFPAAIGIVGAVEHIRSQWTVIIENKSDFNIEGLYLHTGIEKLELGNITKGSYVEKKYHFSHEGRVNYFFRHNKKEHEGILIGYTTPGLGGFVRLSIDSQNQLAIKEEI